MNEPHSNLPLRVDRFVGEHRFLSNFFPCPVSDERGVVYPSVEHAYQAAKASTDAERRAIVEAPTAKKAKHRGSKLTPPADWKHRKVEVMRSLLLRKFAAGTELARLLLSTGDAELVEGNDWGDEFWGRCNGVGENHLGRLLMDIRSDLRVIAASIDSPPGNDPPR